MKRNGIFVLCILFVWACAGHTPGEASQYRRVMPPPSLKCDRNDLTSYTGDVGYYQRDERWLSIVINTDADTVERVLVELLPDESWGDRLLINSGAFDDFATIEASDGTLLPDMRAIAWVCEGADIGPVIDWRPGS